MSKSPTPIVTDTARISAFADALLKRAEAGTLSKNTVLNLFAGTIAPRRNWGYLKGLEGPFIDPGIDKASLPAIADACADTADRTKRAPGAGLLAPHGNGTFVLRFPQPRDEVILYSFDLFKALEIASLASAEPAPKTVSFDLRDGDGSRVKITLPTKTLQNAIQEVELFLVEAVLATEWGQSIHAAFELLCQTEEEIVEAHQLGEISDEDVETASRMAVLVMLRQCPAHLHEMRFFTTMGQTHLVNHVIDSHHLCIYEALPELHPEDIEDEEEGDDD